MARKAETAAAAESIRRALAAANGRRRERIVGYPDAVAAIGEALRTGSATARGGTVANCYRYPARQTQLAAVACDSVVLLWIGETSASKGTADLLPWRANASAERIAATAREIARRVPERSPGYLRISKAAARAIVAAGDRADA